MTPSALYFSETLFGNETTDTWINPEETLTGNHSTSLNETDFIPGFSNIYDADWNLNMSTMGDNSTISNSTGVDILRGTQLSGNNTTVPEAQLLLELTDMSKVKSSLDRTTEGSEFATEAPLLVTPIPLQTSTMSETEVLLRKLANEILVKLFDRFVLKAAAFRSPTKNVAATTTSVPQIPSPATVELLTADRRTSSLRRRLFYGGQSEYEGLEESGYYRPEIEREHNMSF